MALRSAVCLIAVLLGGGAANAQGATPERSEPPAIEHITGGIGSDDVQQLKAREKDFNLKLVFTLVEGNYVSDVDVTVKDSSGKSLLAVTSNGPIVLAKLPRGTYIIQASYENRVQSRKVSVGERLRTEFLRWPSSPDKYSPGLKRRIASYAGSGHSS